MSYAAKCLLVFPFALVLAVLRFNVNDYPLVSSSYFYTRVCFILLGFWQSLLFSDVLLRCMPNIIKTE